VTPPKPRKANKPPKKVFSRNYNIRTHNFSQQMPLEPRVSKLAGKELRLFRAPLIHMCCKRFLSCTWFSKASILKSPGSVSSVGALSPRVVRKRGRGSYLSRFGAHTRARFLACMLVLLLKEAMWARCRIRYSKVL
jgi:hypothetical protein